MPPNCRLTPPLEHESSASKDPDTLPCSPRSAPRTRAAAKPPQFHHCILYSAGAEPDSTYHKEVRGGAPADARSPAKYCDDATRADRRGRPARRPACRPARPTDSPPVRHLKRFVKQRRDKPGRCQLGAYINSHKPSPDTNGTGSECAP